MTITGKTALAREQGQTSVTEICSSLSLKFPSNQQPLHFAWNFVTDKNAPVGVKPDSRENLGCRERTSPISKLGCQLLSGTIIIKLNQ
jgi:hypothetical protein